MFHADGEGAPWASIVTHGLHGIDDEIGEDHQIGFGVSHEDRQVVTVFDEADIAFFEGAVRQEEGTAHDIGEAHFFGVADMGAARFEHGVEEGHELFDGLREAIDEHEGRFSVIQRCAQSPDDHAKLKEGVLELVGDGAGELCVDGIMPGFFEELLLELEVSVGGLEGGV